jgi:hypothetical protein
MLERLEKFAFESTRATKKDIMCAKNINVLVDGN